MTLAISAWAAYLLGQTDGAAGAAAASSQIESIWDLAVKGGPVMIPIAVCSLVALTVIIERAFSLRRRNVIPPAFLSGVRAVLDGDLDDRLAAVEYCQNDGSPVAAIFETGIRRLGEPIALLEKHIQETGERVVNRLRKYLRLLSVIASISPLLGLLGTIFGMIKAFQTVAMSGEALGKAELLAKGIYEAMITTAAGLLVAIPALVAYHWIFARIDQLVVDMDQLTCAFVEDYAGVEGAERRRAPAIRAVRQAKDEHAAERESAVASA